MALDDFSATFRLDDQFSGPLKRINELLLRFRQHLTHLKQPAILHGPIKDLELFNAKLKSILPTLTALGQAKGLTSFARQVQGLQQRGLFNAFIDGLKQVRVAGSDERLNAGFFKFRTNIQKLFGPVGELVNSVAIGVRALARIRTAIFLLLTVFAVRPVIRLFETIASKSFESLQILNEFKRRWDFIITAASKAAAPTIGVVLTALTESFENFFAVMAANPEVIRVIINGILELGNILKNFALIVGSSSLAFVAAAKATIVYLDYFFNKLDIFFTESEISFRSWINDNIQLFKDSIGIFEILFPPLRLAEEKVLDALNAIQIQIISKNTLARASLANLKIDALKLVPSMAAAGFQLEKIFSILPGVLEKSIDELRTFSPTLAAISDGIVNIITATARAAKEAKDKVKVFTQEWQQGTLAALYEFSDRAQKVIFNTLAKGLAEAFETNLGDTLFNVMQGKLNTLKDVVVNFLQDIQRALAKFASQQLTTGLLNFLIGTAAQPGILGNLFGIGTTPSRTSSLGSVTGQHGLIAFGRQRATIGEAGPEAVIPLRGGKVPVQLSRSDRSVSVVFNIQTIDSTTFSAWLKKEGSTIRQLMIDAALGQDTKVRQAFKLA